VKAELFKDAKQLSHPHNLIVVKDII